MKKEDRILITGANGFLGKYLVHKLKLKGYQNIIIFSSEEYDLTKEVNVDKLFKEKGTFEVVIHLAAVSGGIGFNMKSPGTIYYKNIMMNTLIQEYALRNNVRKFVGIGSVCEYPKFTKVPFNEENLWSGYPEETNAPYGLAKKMMLVQSQSYRKEFGFNAVHLLLLNLYGPGGNFDLENSHVIGAFIRKFCDAKKDNKDHVTLWGDGSTSREFLYVEDAAEAIIIAAERYNKGDPINIGSGQSEIIIKDLANTVKKFVGYEGEIIWDTSKPNGQPRRCLDVSRAEKEFGFEAKVDLREGLEKTVEWYINKNVR